MYWTMSEYKEEIEKAYQKGRIDAQKEFLNFLIRLELNLSRYDKRTKTIYFDEAFDKILLGKIEELKKESSK